MSGPMSNTCHLQIVLVASSTPCKRTFFTLHQITVTDLRGQPTICGENHMNLPHRPSYIRPILNGEQTAMIN